MEHTTRLAWLTVPNLLTFLRLLAIPFVVRAILDSRHSLALAIFAAVGLSDAVDGILARRFQWTSAAGAYLDPIADKLLLSCVYLSLAIIGSVPLWLVGIIFGRDVLILASAGLALLVTSTRRFPPSVWGKASTFLQLLTAGAFMVKHSAPFWPIDSICSTLIWVTAAATIWSGIHYGWRGLHLLRTH